MQVKFIVIVAVWSLSFVWLFCGPMDYSPPGFSVHGISQTRILEWVAISFSRGSFWLRDRICVSYLGRCVCVYIYIYIYIYMYVCMYLTIEPLGKPQQVKYSDFYSLCFDSWVLIDIQRRVLLHCASIDDCIVFFTCSEWWTFFLTNSETNSETWSVPPCPLPAFCLWWKTLVID